MKTIRKIIIVIAAIALSTVMFVPAQPAMACPSCGGPVIILRGSSGGE
jgi:hypothetical protein